MPDVVVVTGSSAGVGRAAAAEFARHGHPVGLLARGEDRLETTAAALRAYGVAVCPVAVDVADPEAVEQAADKVEAELGPIGIWVNNAMATVFSPVSELTAHEIRRGTEVTYLGTVHGTMTALRRMGPRGRGSVIQVGSALSYRGIPLQAVYCGAKFAIRGFTESLRAELLHDRSPIHLTMVHLPAMNTPQFDWALNHTGRRARPVPPVFQPEAAARAIYAAAMHPHRDIWVGWPTIKAILASALAPSLVDHFLARNGFSSQTTTDPLPADAPSNLFSPPAGSPGTHGRFGDEARAECLWFTSEQRNICAAAALTVIGGLGLLCLRTDRRH
jgi:short-subunit dehydrogenase